MALECVIGNLHEAGNLRMNLPTAHPEDNSFLANERPEMDEIEGTVHDVLEHMFPACPDCGADGCIECNFLGVVDRDEFEAWQDANNVVDDMPLTAGV